MVVNSLKKNETFRNILHDAQYRTDYYLREFQRLNIPHWIDMELNFRKVLYSIKGLEMSVWGGLYTIGKLYDQHNGLKYSKLGWDRKYWMNEIMQEANDGKRHCTPFIIFRELENGKYQAIPINYIAIEIGPNNRAYLYINHQFEEGTPFINDKGVIEDTSKFKILLLPTETDYLCSNKIKTDEELTAEMIKYNNRYHVSNININLDENGILLPNNTSDWYESIKIIAPKINVYSGSISNTDRAIRINTIPYGKKIFLCSLLLITPDGEIDIITDDMEIYEMENNIIYFTDDRFTGYRYYIFFHLKADTSINRIYDLPEELISHDTNEFITNTNNYYLLNKEFFMDLMNSNNKDLVLTDRDLIEKYSDLYHISITDDTYKPDIYIRDEEDNILLDEQGIPVLDESKFINDGPVQIIEYDDRDAKINDLIPIQTKKENRYSVFIQFINYWFYRVLNYKKSLLLEYIDPKYNFYIKDNKYSSIVYTIEELINTAISNDNNGWYKFKRTIWTLYDKDNDYDGYSDILLFVDGYIIIDKSIIGYTTNTMRDPYFYININNLRSITNEDSIIEIIYIHNTSDKLLDLFIEGKNKNFHKYKYDRYYSPYSINFFTSYFDVNSGRLDIDNTPIYKPHNDNNKIFTQPILYKINNFNTDEREIRSIQFNENWSEILKYEDGFGISSAIIRELDNSYTLFTTHNMELKAYDITEVINSLRDEYFAEVSFESLMETGLQEKETNILPMDILKDEKIEEVFSLTYYRYENVREHAIICVYGEEYYQHIAIGTNYGYQLIEDIELGNVLKVATNDFYGQFVVYTRSGEMPVFEYNIGEGIFEFTHYLNTDIPEINKITVLKDELTTYATHKSACYNETTNKLYILEFYNRLKSVMVEYDVESYYDGEIKYTITEVDRIVTDWPFVGPKMVCDEENNTIYIVGGLSSQTEIDCNLFKYDCETKEFIKISTNIRLGWSYHSLCISNNKLFICGGFGSIREDAANKIGVYYIDEDRLEIVEMPFLMVDSIVFENDENHICVLGGYSSQSSETVYNDNMHTNVYLVNTDDYTVIQENNFPVPIAGGIAVREFIDNFVYIIGNQHSTDTHSIYRFDTLTCIAVKITTLQSNYNGGNIIPFNASNLYAGALVINSIDNGYNYSEIIVFTHNYPDTIFADKNGEYNLLYNGIIYTYITTKEDEKNYWIPTNEIKDLLANYNCTIQKIMLSGDIYIALAANDNIVFTTPDMVHWYDYQFVNFYTDDNIDESNNMINLDCVNEVLDDMMADPFYRNKGIITTNTSDGRVLINPYCANMSALYDNRLIIASKRRFVTYECEINESTDYIALPDEFRFCFNELHYVLFIDNKIISNDCYKIIFPDIYSPVNGIKIYLKFQREEGYSHIMQILYLPFPIINTNVKSEYLSNAKLLRFDSTNISPYGVNNNWNWLFTDGIKVPFKYLNPISNNLVHVKITSNKFNWNNIGLYTTNLKLFDNDNILLEDRFDIAIRSIFDTIIGDPDWDINEDRGNYQEFLEKSTIEDKIILLKVYADNYVGNSDLRGNVAPYILDYETEYYQVKNGNIIWRD